MFFREHALPRLQPDLINSSRRRTIGSPPVFRSSKCRSWRVGELRSEPDRRVSSGLRRGIFPTNHSDWGMTAIMDDARTGSHAFLFSPHGAGSRRHLDERFSAPEVLEPIRSQLGVADGVLNVLVPEPGL